VEQRGVHQSSHHNSKCRGKRCRRRNGRLRGEVRRRRGGSGWWWCPRRVSSSSGAAMSLAARRCRGDAPWSRPSPRPRGGAPPERAPHARGGGGSRGRRGPRADDPRRHRGRARRRARRPTSRSSFPGTSRSSLCGLSGGRAHRPAFGRPGGAVAGLGRKPTPWDGIRQHTAGRSRSTPAARGPGGAGNGWSGARRVRSGGRGLAGNGLRGPLAPVAARRRALRVLRRLHPLRCGGGGPPGPRITGRHRPARQSCVLLRRLRPGEGDAYGGRVPRPAPPGNGPRPLRVWAGRHPGVGRPGAARVPRPAARDEVPCHRLARILGPWPTGRARWSAVGGGGRCDGG
jgi:hypothetical protein